MKNNDKGPLNSVVLFFFFFFYFPLIPAVHTAILQNYVTQVHFSLCFSLPNINRKNHVSIRRMPYNAWIVQQIEVLK